MKKVSVLLAAFLVTATAPALSQGHAMGDASEAAPFGMPVDDQHVWVHLIADQLEGRWGGGSGFRWNAEAWAGTDTDRVWVKSEGVLAGSGALEEGRHELLYARPITSFFDAQLGLRMDADNRPGRAWAALGVEGLAPLFMHVSATGYVSDGGRLAGRLEGSYDLLLTQELVLQPRLELNLYSRSDAARLTGAGLSDLETGLRLRYEVSRKFAPYVGFSYENRFAGSANLARLAGEKSAHMQFVAGLRLWY